jgi:hypothetical protein
MSELKTYKMVDEKYCTDCVCVIPSEVYLKSEADKVIAELEENHKKEVGQLLMEIAELKKEIEVQKRLRNMALASVPNALKVMKIIQHHKYKRCLAKSQEWRNYAAFCGMQSYCHNHRGFGKTAEKYSWKEYHAWKCVHRYKELAEKFKETK